MKLEDVNSVWEELQSEISEGKLNLSSEKSLVFHYAWRIGKNFPDIVQSIDFEKTLFENFSDGTFLDLYYQDVGIEFKLPKKNKNGYSNQTQTRVKIINDIKRLSYLVNEKKISVGYFLMLTDEKAYTKKGKKTKDSDFEVYNEKMYKEGNYLPKNSDFKEDVILPNDLKFEWEEVMCKEKKKIWFLKPIEIRL